MRNNAQLVSTLQKVHVQLVSTLQKVHAQLVSTLQKVHAQIVNVTYFAVQHFSYTMQQPAT